MSPVFNEQDIDRMSEGLGITGEEFKSEYLKLEDNCLVFKQKPCPFLKGNICTMYEFRTEECRSFPHLHKDRFAAWRYAIEAWRQAPSIYDFNTTIRFCLSVFFHDEARQKIRLFEYKTRGILDYYFFRK